MHQRVDLELRVFERLRRGLLHLLVDHLSNPGIQTDLWGDTTTHSEVPLEIKAIKELAVAGAQVNGGAPRSTGQQADAGVHLSTSP